MNKVYRLVWNHAQQAWVVASELARGATKGASRSAMGAIRASHIQPATSRDSLLCGVGGAALTLALLYAGPARAQTVDVGDSNSTVVLQNTGPANSKTFVILSDSEITPATGDGVSANSTQNWDITNNGSITGQTGGIRFGSANVNATTGAQIKNFGSIVNLGTASGGANAGIVALRGGGIINQQGGSITSQSDGIYAAVAQTSVTNSGTIGANLTGVYFNAGGTFNQTATGIVEGVTGANSVTYGVIANAGIFTGSNAGSISALGNGYAYWQRGGSGSFTNTGSLSASIGALLATNASSLSNSGTVTGTSGTAISITGSGNSLILGSGSILNGNAVSTNVNNSLRLEGSGSEDSDLTGFQSLTMAGANWTLSGTVQTTGAISGSTNVRSGVLTVTGSLTNVGDALIGGVGGGELRIQNGGTVSDATGTIGRDAGEHGTVTVGGRDGSGNAATWTNSNSMRIGDLGTGSLTIDSGGFVRSQFSFNLGYGAEDASGTLLLKGTAADRGVLEALSVRRGQGTASVTFDGGLLRAIQNSASFFTGFGTQDVTLDANGGVIDSNGFAIGISPRFVGTGGLTKVGAGTLTLTGDSTYIGGTTIAAGALQLGNNGTTGSIVGDIVNDGSLVFSRSNSLTFDGLVSGTGSLIKNGAGTLTLTGANSYDGATTVNAGTLQINGNQSAATGLVTIASGATLGGNGTVGGSVAVNDGTLAPGAGGVGTLTILGDLNLGANSVLSFELGASDTVGGAYNDLLEVQGNLTLDGTLDVAVSAGGNYGPGFYRLINYSGTLIDNTLNLGTMPAGAAQTLQTSVTGQVNLINTQGLVLRWWDGDAGVRHDGVIAGGAGTWLADAPGSNIDWTDETGTPNGAFLDSSFAMFTNAPGTVAVDDSLGAVRVTGMQFTVDGYRIEGDALTLSSGTNTIRVGDGTAASANMSATIAADLTGAGRLDKGDGGTLILTANNTYTGGTTISAGTLQLGDGGTAGGIVGDVVSNGTLAFNRSDAVTFGNVISGDGSVSQRGSGNTTLSAVNTYGGGTTISAGTLTGSATSFGSGNILDNAALVINQPTNAEFANAISGSGTLTKLGAGVLTLTGSNTHTGATTIGAGTLQLGNGGTSGSLSGDIVNNGLLSFNRSDAVTHAGNISAFGNVTHAGTGTTTLTGASEVKVLAVTEGELRLADGARMQIQGGVNDNLLVGGTATPVLTLSGSNTSLTMNNAAFRIVDTTAGNGIANIEAGAEVKVAALHVGGGVKTGKQAVLNVSGEGTRLELTGVLSMAANAQSGSRAEVNVSDGASVSVSSHTAGGIAPVGVIAATTVSGSGTRWTNSAIQGLNLYTGTLDVLDGATYQTTAGRIGSYNGAIQRAYTGSLRVDGDGSVFNASGDVSVGFRDTVTGIVTLSNGGTLRAGGNLRVAEVATSVGRFNIGAASGEAAARAGVLDAATLSFGAGTGSLTFNHTDADYVFGTGIGGNGTIHHEAGTTTLTGNGSAFAGTTTVNGGTLYVGDGGIGSLGNATSTLTVASGATLGGSGVIGGAVTVANGGRIAPGNSPGTLTTASLTLNSGSLLDYELGARNVAGGALNDLINVNGDLTLAGTVNVAQAAGGSFDVGIYRLINYTGAFTNNTLNIGTLPTGSNPANILVQTEIANQVNLINTGGLQFRFWDGPTGHGNGAFDGNDGVWLATSDSNWTVFDPYANGAWTDTAFAVFQGTPGMVSVNDSAGDVRFSGAQFLVDGYTIDGPSTLGTDAASTVIRVGDGTAAGAAMTATINTQIVGSGGLVKSDAGTLILGGDNSYTGGTQINGGTLQIGDGGFAGSIVTSDIVNDGTLAFGRADAVSFGGTISGSGSVDQRGSGPTTLADVNTYSGGTSITAGTLVGTARSFGSGAITSNGTLIVDQAADATMANVIDGTGNVDKQGAGALNLTGDSSAFAGSMNVTGGTLRVNNVLGDATSTVGVSNGATLGGAGTIGGSVTVTNGRLAAGNSPGTLTIGGDLDLDAASLLDFELGEAGVVGGALNDLIVVGGNLTLDGTLNVSASVGGTYGAGIYRLINYSGTLTDNGLQLGLMPAGSTNYVQTSIAHQVNLVNTQGLLLRYWDGPALPRNNNRIDGGNGVWLAAGDENWTLPDGSINGAYQNAAYAVFAGAPGTVAVDDSVGAINVSGMQFAVDGYRIEGDAVALVAGSNEIRVGDNSAASAGYRATIANELTGAGALNKRDLGTLVLAGTNSYTGGTMISEGTLQLGEGGTSGSIVGDVANDGTLAFDRSDAVTFGGAISGTGAVHQIGTGATALTSVNTYTGETRIDSGTLTLNGAGSIASSSNVVADGVFDISATDSGASITTLSGSGSAVLGAKALTLTAATGTFDGIVTGAGTLNKAGADTWTLNGAGSAVGTLNVQSGSLAIASGASVAAQTTHVVAGTALLNAGTLTGTNAADRFMLDGRLTGNVSLLDGDDRVQVATSADFAQAAFDGGAGVDTLELTHGSALTYRDTLATNFEHLIKRGSGVLTFAGAVTGFSDSIAVAEGAAHLSNAALATSRVHVQTGATLTGIGSMSGDLANDGLLSPGASPGTLSIGGSFVQSASGTLRSEIQRGGNDLLSIAGSATLAGTHQVQIDYGLYLDGTTQTLLRSTGGVGGTFGTVTINPSALMSADHRVGSNDVTVSFARRATTTVTQPGTGRGNFAEWLEEQIARGGLTPGMVEYIDTLLQQPTAEQASNLLGEMAEPIASTSQESVSILGAGFAGAVFDRFVVNDRAQCASATDNLDAARNCAWIHGVRQWGDASGDRFGPRYDWTTDGVQIGIDHTTAASWTLGASAGYADTNTRDVRDGRNNVHSILGGLYANYAGDRLGASAVLLYADHESRTARNARLGTTTYRARAQFDYDSYGAGLRLDYRLTDAQHPLVRPFAEVFYDRVEGIAFAEHDAGAGNLAGRIHAREGLRGTLGVQLADDYEGYGLVFRPSLELGVVHQFLDTQSTLDLQPFGLASGFRAYGVQLDRTAVKANAALDVALSRNATLTLGYGGELANDRAQHEVSLGFRVLW